MLCGKIERLEFYGESRLKPAAVSAGFILFLYFFKGLAREVCEIVLRMHSISRRAMETNVALGRFSLAGSAGETNERMKKKKKGKDL